MPCGKKRKKQKMNTHKRKKRLRANRHKKKQHLIAFNKAINRAMNQHTLTVSELNKEIKNLVQSGFSRITVKGEISGLKPPRHDHMYFDIKDNASSLPCANV